MSLDNEDLFVVQRGDDIFKVKSKSLKQEFNSEALVFVGPNPPADPVQGTLWWSTLEGSLFIYYGPDPNGSSQWVDASPAFVEIGYELIAQEIYKLYDGQVVTSVQPGENITVDSTFSNGRGDVTINADLTSVNQQIDNLTQIVADLTNRLNQLDDLISSVKQIDGGYPNAEGVFTKPDCDGGPADASGQTPHTPIADGGNNNAAGDFNTTS